MSSLHVIALFCWNVSNLPCSCYHGSTKENVIKSFGGTLESWKVQKNSKRISRIFFHPRLLFSLSIFLLESNYIWFVIFPFSRTIRLIGLNCSSFVVFKTFWKFTWAFFASLFKEILYWIYFCPKWQKILQEVVSLKLFPMFSAHDI